MQFVVESFDLEFSLIVDDSFDSVSCPELCVTMNGLHVDRSGNWIFIRRAACSHVVHFS